MLVLSRKKDQCILIGDEIVVMLIRVEGDRCRLGITAPADVRILRAELIDADPEPGDEPTAGA